MKKNKDEYKYKLRRMNTTVLKRVGGWGERAADGYSRNQKKMLKLSGKEFRKHTCFLQPV